MLGATRGTGCPHWLRGLQAPSEGTGLFFRDSRDTALPSKNVGGNVQPQRSTAPWSHQMGQRPGVLLPAETLISLSLWEPPTCLNYILFS